jgi:hypothetical protein
MNTNNYELNESEKRRLGESEIENRCSFYSPVHRFPGSVFDVASCCLGCAHTNPPLQSNSNRSASTMDTEQ